MSDSATLNKYGFVATLYGWYAKRAGGYITITHSAGKVTSVASIYPDRTKRMLVATTSSGDQYELASIL